MSKEKLNQQELLKFLFSKITKFYSGDLNALTKKTILIGENNIISSNDLFEIFMDLEVYLKCP